MVCVVNQFWEKFSHEQYKEFMYCKDNEGNYPCGQQNCWVTCHCNS